MRSPPTTPTPTAEFADLLQEQDRVAEADQAWDAIAAGVPDAHAGLADLLRGQGRDEEAEQAEQCRLQPESRQPR
jgi:hypothetical protein